MRTSWEQTALPKFQCHFSKTWGGGGDGTVFDMDTVNSLVVESRAKIRLGQLASPEKIQSIKPKQCF